MGSSTAVIGHGVIHVGALAPSSSFRDGNGASGLGSTIN